MKSRPALSNGLGGSLYWTGMAEKKEGAEPLVDWVRVLGGALAAVSSAVLLSTLGAVGTLIGAALGSIVVSVASSLYSQGLRRSRERMTRAQEAALRRVGVAQAEVLRARRRTAPGATDAHLEHADEQLDEARDRLETELAPEAEPDHEPFGQRLRALPWKRIALLTGLMFVIAVVAITAFELVAGRSVSSYTGGTSSRHGTSFSNLDNGHHKPSKTPSAPVPSSPVSSSGTPAPGSAPTSPATSAPTTSTPEPSTSESPSDLPTPTIPGESPSS